MHGQWDNSLTVQDHMKLKLDPQWQRDGGKVQSKVGIAFAKNAEEALKCLPLEHIPKYFK